MILKKRRFAMINLNIMHETETMNANGGTKRYFCPWNDYSNTSYWKTYGHLGELHNECLSACTITYEKIYL